MARLAIIATHPIQYYSPWFRYIAEQHRIDLKVFYLWDFGVRAQRDAGFHRAIEWDIPLLDGYDHEFVPNRSPRPGTNHFRGLDNPQLGRRINEWNPGAVLMMAYNYAGLYRYLAGRPRVPHFFRGDSHRLNRSHGARESLRRSFIQFIFRRFDGVLCVGSANRDYFRYHGVPANRIFLSPHAVDTERFRRAAPEAALAAREWRREIGIPEDATVALYLGKFQRIKRVGDLVAAFRRSSPQKSALLLVGEGEEGAALRTAAEGDTRIYFAPFQNQSLVPRTILAGDVVILPSESETWGLVLNEAMSLGRGIIASDRVGGARDLIVPGANGMIYPVGDIEALGGILSAALSDRATLDRWGSASSERIEQFSYARAAEGLYEALRSCRVPC